MTRTISTRPWRAHRLRRNKRTPGRATRQVNSPHLWELWAQMDEGSVGSLRSVGRRRSANRAPRHHRKRPENAIVGDGRAIHQPLSACDGGQLRQYHDNRPNPLMLSELPTVGPDDRLT
jgi:hypothetical protein